MSPILSRFGRILCVLMLLSVGSEGARADTMGGRLPPAAMRARGEAVETVRPDVTAKVPRETRVRIDRFADDLFRRGREQETAKLGGAIVADYRKLAKADPETYRQPLASWLTVYAIALAVAEHPREALAAAEEAVRIQRALVRNDPAAHTPGLVSALGVLARRQADLDRDGEAARTISEALTLMRPLARAQPKNYQRDMLSLLHTQLEVLVGMKQWAAAAKAANEAIALAGERPSGSDDLILTTRGLAYRALAESYGRARQWPQAIAAGEKAVADYRALARRDPSHQYVLAFAISDLSDWLAAAQRPGEALPYSREAAKLLSVLARKDPDTFGYNYAVLQYNISVDYFNLGQNDEALAAIDLNIAYMKTSRVREKGYYSNVLKESELLRAEILAKRKFRG